MYFRGARKDMVVIDVVALLKDIELFCIIVNRRDGMSLLNSQAYLVFSLATAESDVKAKEAVFRAAGRDVRICWKESFCDART